eukprot:193049-Prorocentrum_minimum.AAC.8
MSLRVMFCRTGLALRFPGRLHKPLGGCPHPGAALCTDRACVACVLLPRSWPVPLHEKQKCTPCAPARRLCFVDYGALFSRSPLLAVPSTGWHRRYPSRADPTLCGDGLI